MSLTSTTSLELNIRQLILSDLASNIGEVETNDAAADSVLSAIDLVTSKVKTRVVDEEDGEEDTVKEEEEEFAEQRVFMVCTSNMVFSLCVSPILAQFASAMQHWLRRTRCEPPELSCQ